MKKSIAFFIGVVVCMVGVVAMAADFQVKKASPVKKQEKSGLESITTNSLLPGVVGLITNVSALTKQQKELQAECVPTSTELNWVDNMVKEYAKVGEEKPEDMVKRIGMKECATGESYKDTVKMGVSQGLDPCVDVFSEGDVIWKNYPKTATGTYCADGSLDICSSSKKKTVTNMYAIFGAISFVKEDYTAGEADTYIKLMEKTEKCAPEKISQRSRAAYTEFLKTTITGAGQKTNTGTVWDAIGTLTQSGGGLSGLGGLAPTVTQFFDK